MTPIRCPWICLIIRNMNIYIVKGWGYEWFLRYKTFNEMGWVGEGGHGPVGIPSQCHWICLIIRNTYMV